MSKYRIELINTILPETPLSTTPPGGGYLGTRLIGRTDARGSLALVLLLSEPSGRPWRSFGLWDLARGRRIPGDWIALHHDGQRGLRAVGWRTELADIASGRRVLTLESRRPTSPPRGGLTASHAVDFCPDAPYAVRGLRRGADRQTKVSHLWPHQVIDLATGAVVHELEGKFLLSVFIPGGRLWTMSAKGAAMVWDLAAGKIVAKPEGLGKRPRSLHLNRTGTRLLAGGSDGGYKVWSTESLARLRSGKSKWIIGEDARFADGRHVLGTNAVLDTESRRGHRHWLEGNISRYGATVPLGEWPLAAVLCSSDGVEVWDVAAGSCLGQTEVPDMADALCFLPPDRLLIIHDATDLDDEDPEQPPLLTMWRLVER